MVYSRGCSKISHVRVLRRMNDWCDGSNASRQNQREPWVGDRRKVGEGVADGGRRSLVRIKVIERGLLVASAVSSLECAVKDWSEVFVHYIQYHSDGVSNPIDDKVHIEGSVVVCCYGTGISRKI